MADTVQIVLERMVPELQDLQERGIFSEDEIKAIIKRRRSFEYLFVKRTPNEDDYARAIEYELGLEALRLKRKERLGLKKTTMSDHAGMRRIHFIFDRACRKFRADTKWWLQWIDYSLRTNAAKATSRIFARALQLHPLCEDLWLQAATFEYDRQNNIAAARAIMLRSIRVNPNSLKLWLAYFRMECLYVLRMKSRRIMLGLDVGDKVAQPAENKEGEGISEEAGAKSNNEDGYDVDLPDLDKDLEANEESQDSIRQIGLELGRGLQSLSNDDPSLSEFASTLVKDIQSSIADALENQQADAAHEGSKMSSLASVPSNISPLAAFFQGSVPRIVYAQAIQQLTSSNTSGGQSQQDVASSTLKRAYFHIAFLKAATDFVDHTIPVASDDPMYGFHFSPEIRASCAPFAFPSLVQHILDTMVEECPQEPIVWETMAMMPFIPIVKGIETRKKIRDIIDASKSTGHLASLSSETSSSGPIQAVENEANDDLFMIDTGGDTSNLQEEAQMEESETRNSNDSAASSSSTKKLSRRQRKRMQLTAAMEEHTNHSLSNLSPFSTSLSLVSSELTQNLMTYSDFCHLLSSGIMDNFILDGSISAIRGMVHKAFAAAGLPTNRTQEDRSSKALSDSIALFSNWMFNVNADTPKAASASMLNVPSVLQTHIIENSLVPLSPSMLPLWSVPISPTAAKRKSEKAGDEGTVPVSTPNAADPLPLKGDDVSLVKLSEKGASSVLAVLTVAFETAMLSWNKEVSQWKKRFQLQASAKRAPGNLMSEVLTLLEENTSAFQGQQQTGLSSFPLPFTPFAIGVSMVKCLLYIASMPFVQSTHNTRRVISLYKLAHEKVVELKTKFFDMFHACAYIPSLSLSDKAQVLHYVDLASTLHAVHVQILLRMGNPLTALMQAKEAVFSPLAAISPTPWILYSRLHALLRHWYNAISAVYCQHKSALQGTAPSVVQEQKRSRKRSRNAPETQNDTNKKIDVQLLLSSSRSTLTAPLKKFSRVESTFIKESELFPVSLTALTTQESNDFSNILYLQQWKELLDAQLPISVTLQLGIRALESASYPLAIDNLNRHDARSFKLSARFSALCDAAFPDPENHAVLWVALLDCTLNPQIESTFKASSPAPASQADTINKAGRVLEAALAKSLGVEIDSALREMFLSHAITTDNITTDVLKFALQPNASDTVHYNTLKTLVEKLLSTPTPNIKAPTSTKQSYAQFVQSLRNFFEISLSTHGNASVELWHLALQFEKEIAENHGILQLLEKKHQASKVADLYSKALRSLDADLVPVFQEMMAMGKARS